MHTRPDNRLFHVVRARQLRQPSGASRRLHGGFGHAGPLALRSSHASIGLAGKGHDVECSERRVVLADASKSHQLVGRETLLVCTAAA